MKAILTSSAPSSSPVPIHNKQFTTAVPDCGTLSLRVLLAGEWCGGAAPHASADKLTFSLTLFPLSTVHTLSYTSTYPQSCFCIPLTSTPSKPFVPFPSEPTHQTVQFFSVHKHPVLSLVMRALSYKLFMLFHLPSLLKKNRNYKKAL